MPTILNSQPLEYHTDPAVKCTFCQAVIDAPLDQYGPVHAPVCSHCWFWAKLPCPESGCKRGIVRAYGVRSLCPTCNGRATITAEDLFLIGPDTFPRMILEITNAHP